MPPGGAAEGVAAQAPAPVKEPKIPAELVADLWRTPQALALSAIAFGTGTAAFIAGPYTVQCGALLAFSGAQLGFAFLDTQEDVLFRTLNALALTSGVAVLAPFPPKPLTFTLACISVTACVVNEVRAACVDSTQLKVLAQAGILIPGIVGLVRVYEPNKYAIHAVCALAGSTAVALGVSLQVSGRNSWWHSALTGAGAASVLTAVAVQVTMAVMSGTPHLDAVHKWVGAFSMSGMVVQVALAIPTVWPGLKPSERSLVETHKLLGKVNVVLVAGAVSTGFGIQYGYADPATILAMVMSSVIAFVLVAPGVWNALQLKRISL